MSAIRTFGGETMIEVLRRVERNIVIGVIALSAMAYAYSESFVWACLVDSIGICIATVCVILFGKESNDKDKDGKTLIVGAMIIATMIFFMLSLLFALKWMTLLFAAAITWAIGYVLIRFIQEKEVKQTGFLIFLLIPGWILLIESLAATRPRKSE